MKNGKHKPPLQFYEESFKTSANIVEISWSYFSVDRVNIIFEDCQADEKYFLEFSNTLPIKINNVLKNPKTSLGSYPRARANVIFNNKCYMYKVGKISGFLDP